MCTCRRDDGNWMRTTQGMSWDDFNIHVKGLAGTLASRQPRPDVLIGVARGGLPLLTAMAHRLGLENIGVALVRSTVTDDPFADRFSTAQSRGLIASCDLRDKCVAVVDDIIRSGRTIHTVLNELAQHQPAQVQVAALYAEKRDFAFDYICSSDVHPDTWIEFPWSR